MLKINTKTIDDIHKNIQPEREEGGELPHGFAVCTKKTSVKLVQKTTNPGLTL